MERPYVVTFAISTPKYHAEHIQVMAYSADDAAVQARYLLPNITVLVNGFMINAEWTIRRIDPGVRKEIH